MNLLRRGSAHSLPPQDPGRFDDAILVHSHWEPMEFIVDADHNGGIFGVWPDVTDQEQKDRLHGAQAQDYGFNQGGNGLNAWHKAQWHTQQPYGAFASTQMLLATKAIGHSV